MAVRNTRTLLGVFFCSIGSVCAGPVMRANAQSSASADAPISPISLFDEPEAQTDELPKGQSVNVGSFGQIDLHVKDLDLTKVLQLLSVQSQRNIIATRNVAGTVSADLYGVDFYEAMEAILTPNGFGYREKGNFIYVYTADEIRALDEADRQVVTKVYRLNYLNAGDAGTFVQPLLSQAGSVAVSGAAAAGFAPSIGDGGGETYAASTTLVIRDYPENVEQIISLLTELDVRPKQVLVEATILQADLTENNAWGVDFAIVADANLASFTSPLSAVNNLITGAVADSVDSATAVQSTVGNTAAGPSGIKIGVLGSDAAVFVRALDQVTDTTIIANPKLLVLNRQRADLLVGGRIGYLSTTSTETSTTETVEFLDVGTQLTLRPFISDDEFIRLELRPSLSTGDVRQLGNSVIPETAEQTLTTNVIVRNGQTVVLGGLFKEDTTVNRSQVPGAGDIPILGAALKGQDDTITRTEVIFLIKPTIIRDEVLAEVANEAQDSVRLAQIGAKRGLLPWSRSKMTNANLKDAYKAIQAGDTKKAKWFVDLALNNEPGNIEALRLKQELTGERLHIYDTSILEHATQKMIERQLGAGTPKQDSQQPVAPEASPAPAPSTPTAAPLTSAPSTTESVSPVTEPAAAPVAVEPAPVAAEVTQPEVVAEPAASVAPVSDAPVDWWQEGLFSGEEQAAAAPEGQPSTQVVAPQPQAAAEANQPMDEATADAWLRQLNEAQPMPELAPSTPQPQAAQQPATTTIDLFGLMDRVLPQPAAGQVTEVQTDTGN